MFKIIDLKYKDILDIKYMEFKENHINCIMGESGSGKTTLLKMLNNILSPDMGEIYYKGNLIVHLSPIELRRRVIMLPQTPVIFPGTIFDNLTIGLKFAQLPFPSNDELTAFLDKVQLMKGLSEDCQMLSGGEKQRLTLARVLIMEPECFLLDEFTSALDEQNERIIIEMLTSYCRENKKNLIMVTHSSQISKEFCDNIINIEKQGGIADE